MTDFMMLPVGNVKSPRLHIRGKVERNANEVIWQAIQALSVAAEMAQGVPYLGAISTALTVFMKIQEEVDVCRDECKATMDYARQINALIERFRGECVSSGRGESIFTENLRLAFEKLESIILDSIEALAKCRVDSKKLLDRIRIYYRRSELAKSVKSCAARMHQAMQLFHTTLQVDQVFLLEDIRVAVSEMRGVLRPSDHSQGTAPATMSEWRLRMAPSIFHGRELEVARAVERILNQAPARIAILGPGGIGKTSIALSVLHDAEVKNIYGGNRCFMSCEAITTVDGIIRALAECVGLTLEKNIPTEAAQHCLVSYLKNISGIVSFTKSLHFPLLL
ncbi:hypothetical protein PENSPDRAFT_645716 [Peniophora sp. CONT]|nr:hypothetical protein PENSPDRAFT_645716 [Peniophora sp. CONT]